MAKAATVCDHSKHRYLLAEIKPQDTLWGGFRNEFLCIKDKVLTVKFLAWIMSVRFRDPGGGPPKCASVKFRFFRAADEEVARRLIYAKARPPRGMETCLS